MLYSLLSRFSISAAPFRYPVFLLPLCCLLLSAPAAAQTGTWETFKSFEGRFSIKLPGEVTERVDSIATPVGKLAYYTFFHQPEDEAADNLMYMISYCDYPEGSLQGDSSLLSEFFSATLDAAISAVRGELRYDAERDYFNTPGRFWRIDYLDGKAAIKTWALVQDDRYYALQAITVKQRSLSPASDRFFDSFRLWARQE